ncbi:MAG TPA: hypothetical protein VMM92_15025 [Thermoanaerobaculia bacterium]|nr:hypothetical protein [Thermoanaerobaculia bacterium]
MPFKVRDLVIDVIPERGAGGAGGGVGGGCLNNTLACHYPSVLCRYPTYACTLHSLTACHNLSGLTCPYGSLHVTTTILTTPCGGSIDPTIFQEGNQVDLATLKEQLRIALTQVEAQEKVAEAAARPQTREEAEVLEKKVEAALQEIREIKKGLPSAGK